MSSESVSSAAENEQLVGLLRGVKMEARLEHQTAQRYQALYVFASAIGASLLGMVVWWCLQFRGGFSWSMDRNLQFNWHPVLMVAGLILLYSQSMLLYRTGRNVSKMTLKIWHAALHIGAFICAVIGLVAVFDNHNYTNKANLYTLHSWLGLTCVIIFGLQYVGGFMVFLFPGMSKEIRKISLPIHTAVGMCLFIMAVCVAFMGLTEKAIWALSSSYEDLGSEAVLINFMGIFLMTYSAICVYLVTDPTYKRVALPEEEMALASHAE